jgi:hypothetical protein
MDDQHQPIPGDLVCLQRCGTLLGVGISKQGGIGIAYSQLMGCGLGVGCRYKPYRDLRIGLVIDGP